MGLPSGLKCSVFSENGLVRIGKRWLRIGIRREEKNRWETRAPLTPLHAKDLKKLHDVEVVVQPCNKRIFTNQEYHEVIVLIGKFSSSNILSRLEQGLKRT